MDASVWVGILPPTTTVGPLASARMTGAHLPGTAAVQWLLACALGGFHTHSATRLPRSERVGELKNVRLLLRERRFPYHMRSPKARVKSLLVSCAENGYGYTEGL